MDTDSAGPPQAARQFRSTRTRGLRPSRRQRAFGVQVGSRRRFKYKLSSTVWFKFAGCNHHRLGRMSLKPGGPRPPADRWRVCKNSQCPNRFKFRLSPGPSSLCIIIILFYSHGHGHGHDVTPAAGLRVGQDPSNQRPPGLGRLSV